MGNLEKAFAELAAVNEADWLVSEPTTIAGEPLKPRRNGPRPGTGGRPPKGDAALTPRERDQARRTKAAQIKADNIAILDFETDPFDDAKEVKIRPFLAVLYSHKFDTIVIWEEEPERFYDKLLQALSRLPGRFTIYAHNGGRFDYLFMVHRLRGAVNFKGRGIMSARIGEHEIRDSFHIIPERLANWQKDAFDYQKLKQENRDASKEEIIQYCIHDCKYLLDIVSKFIDGFGMKLTIGQAAMHELRKEYDVPKFSEGWDNIIRQWFFGGRVECLRGRGEFVGPYKYYDVNSLYPYVMSAFQHPIGDFPGSYSLRYGPPNEHTVFINLTCRNRGGLIGRNVDGETTARIPSGEFFTTIWEHDVALRFGLISEIKYGYCVDCTARSNFSRFVIPLYENRLATKSELDRMKKAGLEGSAAFMDMKKDDIFYKLLLNNAYGKFAINPRRFCENYLTDPDQEPPPEWFKSIDKIQPEEKRNEFRQPVFESHRYWIWQKPNPGFRFNNVGVAASVTGAARAVLLEALQLATDPIYCDTDSIICRDLAGVPISKTALGSWDLEDTFTRVIVNGKKLYTTWHETPKRRTADQLADGLKSEYTVKSKGTSRITWEEMDCLRHGAQFLFRNRAPTLDRYGRQYYVKRTIRATAEIEDAL